jgi:hypothetical protein
VILAMLAWALALVPAALAQSGSVPNFQSIPNYTGIGAGQQFRNDVNNHFSGVTPIAPRIVKIFYAQLPAEQDGQEFYLRDGVAGNPCTGGGQGAYAYGVQGQWLCSGTAIANTLLESTAACTGPPTIGNLLAVNGSGLWCDTAAPAIASATLNPGAAQSALTANLHSGATAPLVLLADANANAVETLLQLNTAGHTGVCSLVEQLDGTVTLTCSKVVATGNASVGGTLGVTGNATVGGTLGVIGAATLASTLGLTGAFTWNAGAPDITELNGPRIPLAFSTSLVSVTYWLNAAFTYTPSVNMHIRADELTFNPTNAPSSCTQYLAFRINVNGVPQPSTVITTVNSTTHYLNTGLSVAAPAGQPIVWQAHVGGSGCIAGNPWGIFNMELTTD